MSSKLLIFLGLPPREPAWKSPAVKINPSGPWDDTINRVPCERPRTHGKDSADHVRVRRIMETLKHSAFTAEWLAQLCLKWIFAGKAAWISHGRNRPGTIQLIKQKFFCDNKQHHLFHFAGPYGKPRQQKGKKEKRKKEKEVERTEDSELSKAEF